MYFFLAYFTIAVPVSSFLRMQNNYRMMLMTAFNIGLGMAFTNEMQHTLFSVLGFLVGANFPVQNLFGHSPNLLSFIKNVAKPEQLILLVTTFLFPSVVPFFLAFLMFLFSKKCDYLDYTIFAFVQYFFLENLKISYYFVYFMFHVCVFLVVLHGSKITLQKQFNSKITQYVCTFFAIFGAFYAFMFIDFFLSIYFPSKNSIVLPKVENKNNIQHFFPIFFRDFSISFPSFIFKNPTRPDFSIAKYKNFWIPELFHLVVKSQNMDILMGYEISTKNFFSTF